MCVCVVEPASSFSGFLFPNKIQTLSEFEIAIFESKCAFGTRSRRRKPLFEEKRNVKRGKNACHFGTVVFNQVIFEERQRSVCYGTVIPVSRNEVIICLFLYGL